MDAKTNGAMPVSRVPDVIDHERNFCQYGTEGLTKRELFAAMAMQGLLSGEYRDASPEQYLYVANHAVHHADVLLAELAEAKP